jgi:hypothetical protein
MHPARHRALRELGVFAKQMADHWEALAGRVDGSAAKALTSGSVAAQRVLDEVRPLASARDLEIGPAALNAGRFARARPPVPDAVLEVNQALRFALLDAEHLITLAKYVGALSAADGDTKLEEACATWARSLQRPATAAKRAAIALGDDPDAAIRPISKGQKLGYLFGWFGEATDRRAKRSAKP